MKRPPTLTLDRPTLARAGDLARARRMGEETTSVDLGSSYLARVGAVVEHLQPVRWIDGGVMKNKEVSAPQGRLLNCMTRIQPELHAGTDVISLAVHYTFRLFQMNNSDSLYYSHIDRSIIYL